MKKSKDSSSHLEGQNVLVLGDTVHCRREGESHSSPVIQIREDLFRDLPGGIVLADAFRDYTRIVLREAIFSQDEDIQQLLTSQLLCDLIRFSAAWAHSFWRDHYPGEEYHDEAWKILKEFIRNPLLFVPGVSGVKTNFRVRISELRDLHTCLCGCDPWRVVMNEKGKATIRYD